MSYLSKEDIKEIEQELLKRIHGNGLEISRFVEWLKEKYNINK